MVDLTGKFYLLDELDEAFVKECVDLEKYKEYQGRWVKNAYEPQFTVDGKYDEKAAAAAESLDIYILSLIHIFEVYADRIVGIIQQTGKISLSLIFVNPVSLFHGGQSMACLLYTSRCV